MLRGADRRTLAGLQTMLLQQEVRFPLLRGLQLAIPVPWEFPTVSAALFSDAAWTWENGFTQRLGSVGAGFYVGGGYFPVLRWNLAWLTPNFRDYPKRPRTQFMIGFNF